ncbi:MAG: VWA domain-containing protein [Myxococcaceae bacterium]|nr:VWA domain-containing protein [Myxococcaceae bacterium]
MVSRPLVRALVVVLLGAGCTGALLEPKAVQENNLDDRLSLKGRVCTSPPDPNGFPVKVLFIIDESGSMCVSDPPGAQEVGGFCQQIASRVVPPGVTEPARVRALKKLLDQFKGQPNVEVALVPFETNVKGVWPPNTGQNQARFAPPDSTLDTRVAQLQSELGKGTDYQGALSNAYGIIASDIAVTEQKNPQLLPRTRYVVVFLTDGTPFPRCSANDNLSVYADADNPDLTWADSSGAGDFCNQIDPMDPDAITGFVKGTDRNQNYQLYSYVDQLIELKQQHNIGDIRMHTVLLFNEGAVAACGPICQDIYGTYPNTPPAQYPQAAKKIARYVLTQIAQRGNGVYQEFNNGEIQNLGLGALDYSSLASRNVMKTLLVQAGTSVPGPAERILDTDGDGLDDTLDNSFTSKTNRFYADSDGDCFDDEFEVRHFDDGFRPDQKDTRGCDPASPLSLGCSCRDTDGDGLSQFAERYLKTNEGLYDSDGDGIGDGLEVRYGLDPLSPTAQALDTDGDSRPDAFELRAGSSPIRRDLAFFDKEAYQYETVAEIQPDGRVCYDFTVSNLRLVTAANCRNEMSATQCAKTGAGNSGQQGFNLFRVVFGEAPESGVATDYGTWKAACAWAQFDPPSIRMPAGPDLTLQPSNFVQPQALDPIGNPARCVGNAP